MSFSEFCEMMKEIGDYLYNRYIVLDLSRYHNFSLGSTNTLISKIVISLTIGAMVASIILYIEKKRATKLVQALLKNGCHSEETAKSAENLGIQMNYSLRQLMRKPSPLSKLVYYHGQKAPVAASLLLEEKKKEDLEKGNSEEAQDNASNTTHIGKGDKKEKPSRKEIEALYRENQMLIKERKSLDFQTVPLYIPQNLAYRADVRYGVKTKPFSLIISLIGLPLLALFILRFFPSVLLLADGIITFLN